MPILNPIIQGLTVNNGTDLTLALTDPITAPEAKRSFWFNSVARSLFLAIETNSVADWIALGGAPKWGDIENKPNTFPVDVASVLNKILVADGQVLTTDDNVIFED